MNHKQTIGALIIIGANLAILAIMGFCLGFVQVLCAYSIALAFAAIIIYGGRLIEEGTE